MTGNGYHRRMPRLSALLPLLLFAACAANQTRSDLFPIKRPFALSTVLETRREPELDEKSTAEERRERAAREKQVKRLEDRLKEAEKIVRSRLEKANFKVVVSTIGANELRLIYRETPKSWFSRKDLADDIELQVWEPGSYRQALWITSDATVDQVTGAGLEDAVVAVLKKLFGQVQMPKPPTAMPPPLRAL